MYYQDHGLSEQALDSIHDHFIERAFAVCAKGGTVPYEFLAVRANSKGRVVRSIALPRHLLDSFASIACDGNPATFSDTALTEGTSLRELVTKLLGAAPNLFVESGEVWTSTKVSGSGGGPRGRASGDSDRGEAVVISMHTATGCTTSIHGIVSKPFRHAVRGYIPGMSELLAAVMPGVVDPEEFLDEVKQ